MTLWGRVAGGAGASHALAPPLAPFRPNHTPAPCDVLVHPSSQDHSSPFGRGYICDIADTVTSATDASAGSLEYLVGLDVLEAAAADAGLFPVRDYQEPILSSNFEQVCRVPCAADSGTRRLWQGRHVAERTRGTAGTWRGGQTAGLS